MFDISKLPPDLQKQFKLIEEEDAKSKALPDGVVPGKIFRIQIADGYAVYQVKKVKARTVDIIWRKDLCIDAYQDAVLRNGGTFSIKSIAPIIEREEAFNKIFSAKK